MKIIMAFRKPAACLKSSGIAHAGKDGWFDDIKVWNTGPAR